jgi:hypothetical protein
MFLKRDLLNLLEKTKVRMLCHTCGQWIVPKDGESKDFLPVHKDKKDNHCSGSHYSYRQLEYILETEDEAIAFAKFIQKDNGECLEGGGLHSLGCGDGDNCDRTRLLISKALAEYILAKQEGAK